MFDTHRPKRRIRARALALAIVLLGLPSTLAHAQEETDDASFRAAVLRYLVIQGSAEQMGMSMAYGAANETLMALAQSGVEVTEPMQAIVLEQALETYGKRFGDSEFLTDLWSPIYAQHYTEAEIRQMIAFYESPVGKKSIEVFGTLNESGMAAVQEAAIAIAPGFQHGVTAKLKEAGIEVPSSAPPGAYGPGASPTTR